jgi:ATP-dependent Lon protease
VRYVQGWLVGVTPSTSGLVPFEVTATSGDFAVTHSGPLSADVEESFHLAISAAALALHRHNHSIGEHRLHLNLPLRHVDVRGPSCRLAFANGVIAALAPGVGFPPAQTALFGDLTLSGQVLAVGHTSRKADAARRAGLPRLVVAALPGNGRAVDTVEISSLDEIPGVAR